MSESAALDQKIKEACRLLKAGELVAFPTETVYGLGADAENEAALDKLYRVKGRPKSHPVIVHVASVDKLSHWCSTVPPLAYKLAERYWPGPMTLILPRADHVSDAVTGGQNSVGIRIPNHPLALELLREFGGGVAAPSANRFGKLSPTTAQAVIEGLGGDVACVLDGGPSSVGIESTIISLTGEPSVLRPGMLSPDELSKVLGVRPATPYLDAGPSARGERAPGTLLSHYAPETPVELSSSRDLLEKAMELSAIGRPFAAMAFEDTAGKLSEICPTGYELLACKKDADDYARHLYDRLRKLDMLALDFILVEAVPTAALWDGVADRLKRASTREDYIGEGS